MTNQIDNMQDIIDSRDVIARIEELKGERDALLEQATEDPSTQGELNEWDEDEGRELEKLRALADEGESTPDWQYGETLIRETYFREYAQELAEDCGMIPENAEWPARCIDWDQAARELRMDYMEVDFDGITYLIRV